MYFPGLYIRETHLFTTPQHILLDKLKKKVASPSRKNSKDTENIFFNGLLKENSFIISQNTSYPQYFIPMIRGEFVEGEDESLLKLEYDLFRGSKLYLSLWTSICILAAVFFLLISFKIEYSLAAIVILLINYSIVLGNFNLHSKKSRELLLQIFN
ncbi:hypothetical protein HZR84_08610 [Hyphobacterium sp. CCMP332]|nr:hypothetical protein HZR84_08610 [Hyphobacterium sp. CCMP332]